ncbi:MAG TPA: DegT/DnrJ/EryC1/StrS aminotransferase family protein [Gemmataceae bacterium]|nr:DegT/DnrJ/EryC1/StrS aminotransferase family protein [Gemmataceae bacterium]
MIPRFKPTLGWREMFALLTPAGSGEIERFETAFAGLMGQRHAIACPHGRTGLWLLLQALGLQNREILCPAYTCVVVPHAIVTSGNEPVFIDSQPGDFNMDLDLARAAVTEKTGAIIATSIFGYPIDLDRLNAFRRDFPHVRVIQDCAHSFAAEWQGRPVQREGDAAIYGLNVSKLITSIFGGMVTTDDDALATRMRRLRRELIQPAGAFSGLQRRLYLTGVRVAFSGWVYGFINWLERNGFLNRFVKYYDEGKIDMPADYRVAMSAIQAKVGRLQVDRYPSIIAQRRANARLYHERLHGRVDMILPPLVDGATYSHFVPLVEARPAIVEAAKRHGVQLGTLIDYCIPEMAAYRNRPGNRFPCPLASSFARRSINLPLVVSPAQAKFVCDALEAILKSSRTSARAFRQAA